MTYKLLFVLLLCMPGPGFLFAQSPFDPAYGDAAEEIREDLKVFCDRSIYTVEERISFVAELRVEGSAQENAWSSTLYVELIAADGKAIVQEKFGISGGRVHASLDVPAGALTGEYLLKTYTRWMRNKGPFGFSYTPLKIINPYMKELSVYSNGGSSGRTSADRLPYRTDILTCSTSSSSYGEGDEVRMHLAVEENLMSNALSCCVTVVPEGAIDLSEGSYLVSERDYEEESFLLSYLPDRGDGLSLSGSVVDADLQPAPYTTLHFSLLGAEPDYYAAISDEKGRFNLTATRVEGHQEFFVTPGLYEAEHLEIRIDQEYDSRPGLVPIREFSLSGEEGVLARKLALNMQLSRAYRNTGKSPNEAASDDVVFITKEAPFYGTAVKQLRIDDYVRLPNLEEVFINLVPEIQIYKRRGQSGIRIISENNSIGVYKPLIMIDHISVFDEEAILALSPDKIERIDLINDIYLKGSVAFGGVLAIYSRKGDMAGIDLPAGSYFFDLQGIKQNTPGQVLASPAGSRIPDTRNTIYWNEEVSVARENPADLSFRAPAAPGSYVILVRSLSTDGEVFSASSRFTVE